MHGLIVGIGEIIKSVRELPPTYRSLGKKKKKVFESCFVVEIQDPTIFPCQNSEIQVFKVRYFSDHKEKWFNTNEYGNLWEYI